MSAPAHPPPARVTTHLGDVGCLTYEPLDPAAIEHSVRSAQAGAVVSFVSSCTWILGRRAFCLQVLKTCVFLSVVHLCLGWVHA